MNTAVATKMPAFSPLTAAGSSGPTNGKNRRRPRIREEEQDQRPDLERELEQGIELLLFGRSWFSFRSPLSPWRSPWRRRAHRSSTPSPTPMKCTGSLCLAASATRMPPRAVPSSLVITSPVTPAMLVNSAACDSAFCPTVASRTSSTACGASARPSSSPARLFELRHQFGLVLQASGGVDHAARPRRRLARAVRASNARLAASDPCSRAITGRRCAAPDLQLLDRGGAERVAGREHHLAALGAEARRELADGGGLARAIHADYQNDERLLQPGRSSAASQPAPAPSRPRRRGWPSPRRRSPACRNAPRRSRPRCAPRRRPRDRRGSAVPPVPRASPHRACASTRGPRSPCRSTPTCA